MDIKKELIKNAKEAMKNAYSNYSNFHVGAAVLLKDGKIIIGANIENSSYGLTCCAERTALFQVYSQGYRQKDIVAMAITADFPGPCVPCGACRQVMIDLLNKDTPIYLVDRDGSEHTTNIIELLPNGFDGDSMKE